MPGLAGVLSVRGDLRKSFDCNQKAIQCATRSRAPDIVGEVLAAAQQLSDSGMEIAAKKSVQIKLPTEVSTKHIQLQEGDSSKTALIGAGLDPK